MAIKPTGLQAKGTITNKKASTAVPNSMDIGETADRFNIGSMKTTYSESSTDKDNDDEEKISKVFGKMLPLIEEMDKVLYDILPEKRIDTFG